MEVSYSGRLNSLIKICTFPYISCMVVLDALNCVLNFKEMTVV